MDWFRRAERVLLLGLLGLAASAGTASAADTYDRITFIIGSQSNGGTSDVYSRFLANHMGRFLPGNPTIVPQNMPGGGGIRATNYLYNVAPKDGTAIGMVDQAVYLSQILGVPELKADATRFNWLGRLISNTSVLIAWHDAPVKKIEDAFTQELIVSASGTASRLNWTLLNNVVGTKMRLITGYKGVPEARLAMVRGEIHGLSTPWWDLKNLEGGTWLSEKKVNVLLQTSARRHPELPDLPRMVDLAKNEEDRQLIYLFSQPNDIGRSVIAPPGLPAARVAQLRQAFMNTVNDPGFRAEAVKAKLELDPLSGEDLQQLVTGSGNVPDSVVERAKSIAGTSRSE
jgi:tripartite-type tricarboxylate transporter receptor subunit TctC